MQHTRSGPRLSTASQPLSRMGTAVAFGKEAGVGTGLQQDVHVSARPVTNSGMRGMETASGKRQVQDVTYWVGVVRSKITDIRAEVSALDDETDRLEAEKHSTADTGKARDTLLDLVRRLEGELADFNLAADRARSGADPDEMVDFCRHVEGRNAELAAEGDRIFVERKQREKQADDADAAVASMRDEAQRRIASLDGASAARYAGLLAESRDLRGAADALGEEAAHLARALAAQQGGDTQRVLQERWSSLAAARERAADERARLADLEAALAMDPREAQRAMLLRVKADSAECAAVEKDTRAAKDAAARLKTAVREMKKEYDDKLAGNTAGSGYAADNGGEGGGPLGGQDKMLKLQKREAVMVAFLAKYDAALAEAHATAAASQQAVVQLLEHISETAAHEARAQTTSADGYAALAGEASFKERHLELAENTAARLRGERASREAEMEKLAGLRERIDGELEALAYRNGKMKLEMGQFELTDELKAQAAEATVALEDLRVEYSTRRDAARATNAQHSADAEAMKHELEMGYGKARKRLEGTLKRVSQYELNIHALKEYVAAQALKTGYKEIKVQCGALAEGLNVELVQQLAEPFQP